MWIRLIAFLGVFLVQNSKVATFPSNTDCAVYCLKIRRLEVQLNTNLYLCRCGTQYPAPQRISYSVVPPYSGDQDDTDDLQANDAQLASYKNQYLLPVVHRPDQSRYFKQTPANNEYGTYVSGPMLLYQKQIAGPGKLHSDVIQRKLSSLENTVFKLTTQTKNKDYLINDQVAADDELLLQKHQNGNRDFVKSKTRRAPNLVMGSVDFAIQGAEHKLKENAFNIDHTYEISSDSHSKRFDKSRRNIPLTPEMQHSSVEQIKMLKRFSPLYWSHKEYNVNNTIPDGSFIIMDMGLQKRAENRMTEDSESSVVVKSLENLSTEGNFKKCLNLLEFQNYQLYDNVNKTMTASIKKILNSTYANYTTEEISAEIDKTCNATYTLFGTGVEEIKDKERTMFNKIKTIRSENPSMEEEASTEQLSEVANVEASRDMYWIDASTKSIINVPEDYQVLPEPVDVTKKASSYAKHNLNQGLRHPLVQWRRMENVQKQALGEKLYPKTAFQPQITTQYRPVVLENQRRVPKVIMSEHKAGLQSKFGELEKIDNNDFVNVNDLEAGKLLTSSNSLTISGRPDIEQIHIKENDDLNTEFTVKSTKQYDFGQWPLRLDNLYITNQDVKMPLNFVPNANGKVDILIDGQYICAQLLRESDQSLLLLEILCNANDKEKMQNLKKKIEVCSDKEQNIKE